MLCCKAAACICACKSCFVTALYYYYCYVGVLVFSTALMSLFLLTGKGLATGVVI